MRRAAIHLCNLYEICAKRIIGKISKKQMDVLLTNKKLFLLKVNCSPYTLGQLEAKSKRGQNHIDKRRFCENHQWNFFLRPCNATLTFIHLVIILNLTIFMITNNYQTMLVVFCLVAILTSVQLFCNGRLTWKVANLTIIYLSMF